MPSIRRGVSLCALAMGAVGLASCGDGGTQAIPQTGATLEGKVTYGGEKVPLALVIAVVSGPGGGSANTNCDDDGHYQLKNVPLGTVKLAVNTDAAKGILTGRAMGGVDPTKKGQKLVVPKHVEVPKKYYDPETSGLTTRVEKGPNKFDIEIKK